MFPPHFCSWLPTRRLFLVVLPSDKFTRVLLLFLLLHRPPPFLILFPFYVEFPFGPPFVFQWLEHLSVLRCKNAFQRQRACWIPLCRSQSGRSCCHCLLFQWSTASPQSTVFIRRLLFRSLLTEPQSNGFNVGHFCYLRYLTL